jgi:DNA helicase-2/ATP-dependent DNA helicase PcrA
MTLHCAKGLEFDNVFIIGLEQGILPHEKSMDVVSDIEEERRLFFVGITRAKNRLCITLSRHRTMHGQTIRTIDSQFLYEAALQMQDMAKQENRFEDVEDKDCDRIHCQSDASCPDYDDTEEIFSAGRLVSHKKFGPGRVKEFHNIGDNSIIVVEFKSGQVKPLMLKYAGLSVMDSPSKQVLG